MNNIEKQDFEKCFFFGMGAGKSGSSWLYDYLTKHPEVSPGPLKEMRVASRPEYQNFAKSLINIPWKKYEGRSWLKENVIRAWFRSDWQRYYDCYGKILVGDNKVTGENSPGNMRVSSDAIIRIKGEFNRRNIRVVPIFIMRDPIDRLRSSISYEIKRRRESVYKEDSMKSQSQTFLEKIEFTKADYASGYLDAVDKIRSNFNSDDFFIGFYEEIFSEEKIMQLCKTLNVAYIEANIKEKINESDPKEDIPDDILMKSAHEFSEVYRGVAEIFGKERIQNIWPLSKNVV